MSEIPVYLPYNYLMPNVGICMCSCVFVVRQAEAEMQSSQSARSEGEFRESED